MMTTIGDLFEYLHFDNAKEFHARRRTVFLRFPAFQETHGSSDWHPNFSYAPLRTCSRKAGVATDRHTASEKYSRNLAMTIRLGSQGWQLLGLMMEKQTDIAASPSTTCPKIMAFFDPDFKGQFLESETHSR
jgi:hypothetical protein